MSYDSLSPLITCPFQDLVRRYANENTVIDIPVVIGEEIEVQSTDGKIVIRAGLIKNRVELFLCLRGRLILKGEDGKKVVAKINNTYSLEEGGLGSYVFEAEQNREFPGIPKIPKIRLIFVGWLDRDPEQCGIQLQVDVVPEVD